MDNVYEIEDKYVLIDGEWIYPEWIPYAFIKWRAINELYAKHVDLATCISREDMMKANGVSLEDEALFFAWAVHFAETYAGSSERVRWAKDVQDVSLDAIHRERMLQKTVTMSLYIDCGDGFTEEGKLYQDIDIEDGTFNVVFEAEQLKNAKKLRFDPVEGRVCIAKVDGLSDGLELVGDNSCEIVEKGHLFVNLDPQFQINVTSGSDKVCIQGTMSVLQKEELMQCMTKIIQDAERCKDVVVAQSMQIRQQEEAITRLEQERNVLAAENEKNAYYANSTKAFIKRKILLKLGKIKE